MLSWAPENRVGNVVPRAVAAFCCRLAPTVPSKCTSPPKARVTGFPLPVQSGLRGEWAGNAWVVCALAGAGGVAFLPPPEKKITKISNKKTRTPTTVTCRRRWRTLRETTSALWHTTFAIISRGRKWPRLVRAVRVLRFVQVACGARRVAPDAALPEAGQFGDQAGAGGGDHGEAVVEDLLVAVVGIGHVGGRAGGRIEGAQEEEPVGVGAQAAQGLLVTSVQCHDQVVAAKLRG